MTGVQTCALPIWGAAPGDSNRSRSVAATKSCHPIAGLVIHEAQTIPEPGQAFTFHGYRFEILRKTRNKITALRIKPVVEVSKSDASHGADASTIDAG